MKKTITGFIGACSVLVLVACGSGDSSPAEDGSGSSTVVSSESVAAPAPSALPGESRSGDAPPADLPPADGAPSGDVPVDPAAGSALPRTYAQACSDVLQYLDGYQQAIDETGSQTGITRQSLADDLLSSIQAYPEWSTLSPDEQSEVTRGIGAAADGSC
ncbi:hypothetical protein ABH922_003795 [Rhodococcus sp. 27YEA15]|uniref:hypothetical protein n=1 Tax=Rhodococcus sp. 27YEA15 TaxID=3156259 RepID=UPI003C7CC576